MSLTCVGREGNHPCMKWLEMVWKHLFTNSHSCILKLFLKMVWKHFYSNNYPCMWNENAASYSGQWFLQQMTWESALWLDPSKIIHIMSQVEWGSISLICNKETISKSILNSAQTYIWANTMSNISFTVHFCITKGIIDF